MSCLFSSLPFPCFTLLKSHAETEGIHANLCVFDAQAVLTFSSPTVCQLPRDCLLLREHPAWSTREGSKPCPLQAAHDAESAGFTPGFQAVLLLLIFLARVRLRAGDPTALLPLWSQRDTDLTVNNEKELDFLCYAAH